MRMMTRSIGKAPPRLGDYISSPSTRAVGFARAERVIGSVGGAGFACDA
jgi:hypothetical protein